MKNSTKSIGEVSHLLELPQSVIRYWETVFDVFNPEKSPGGTRKFSENDVELLKKIKTLLYDKKFTIKGANQFLSQKEEISVSIPDKNEYITVKKSDLIGMINLLEKLISKLE